VLYEWAFKRSLPGSIPPEAENAYGHIGERGSARQVVGAGALAGRGVGPRGRPSSEQLRLHHQADEYPQGGAGKCFMACLLS
jgi:hypothetical protein